MRIPFHRLAPAFAGLLIACAPVAAQQDRQAQQQQRRFQLQLQQLQQQLQEAQAAKAKLETELAELKKNAEARERQAGIAISAQRQLDQKLKAAEAERTSLAGNASDLQRQLADETKRGAEALAAKDRELAALGLALRTTEAREQDVQGRFREQLRLVSECSDKNARLAAIGSELLARYRDKGFAEVLRNREPVLGFADVATFELLQELRDRVDAARFSPSVPR